MITNDEAWEIYKNLDRDTSFIMRQAARNSFEIDRLTDRRDEDFGISSSDVNHRCVDMIRSHGRMLNDAELKEIEDELENNRAWA